MLNNKTKYSFIIFSTVLVYTIKAQKIYVGTGIESAFFKNYVNNLSNNTLDLSYSKSYDALIEAGYRSNLYIERLMWDVGVSYNKYQINTGYFINNTSIPLTYNLTYASIKAGINFSVVNERRFRVLLHLNLSHDWFISGTSTYLNVVNDLYRDNTYDRTLISFHQGLSMEYNISDNLATYIKYNISSSFREENKDSNAGEKYTLRTNALSFGVVFNINSNRTICHGGF